jgi:transcriptional regulator with PAS, ATPase and Fis domain
MEIQQKKTHKLKLNSLGDDFIYALIDNPYECPIIIDKDGIIRFLSRFTKNLIGIDGEEAIGKHVTEVIKDTHLHEVLKEGKARIGDMLYIGGRQQLISRIPIKNFEGKLIGAVGKGMINEVTKLWDLQRKVKLLDGQLQYYKDQVRELKGSATIIGESNLIKAVKKKALQAARTNTTVLITGESGTGKEVIAYYIHQASLRAKGPFIKVNCASIPPELFESEFFGYEEGAFTGARTKGKPGKFELAQDGIILLDEIGELTLPMQAKLLRVIQERSVDRLGATKPIPLNFRLMAATNRDLNDMVRKKQFRTDLFFRINILNIDAPSLRQIREDIPLISEHLLRLIKAEIGWGPSGISTEAMEALKNYSWPGNVRELRNILERGCIVSRSQLICPEDLPEKMRHCSGERQDCPNNSLNYHSGNLRQIMDEMEIKIIHNVLRSVNGNKTKASAILGIHRSSLYEKLNKTGTDL